MPIELHFTLTASMALVSSFFAQKRHGLISPITLFSIYSLMCIIVYGIVILSSDLHHLSSVTALPLWRAGSNYEVVFNLYNAISFTIIIGAFLIPRKKASSNLAGASYAGLQKLASSKASYFVGILLLAWAVIHFIDIDRSSIIRNESYLALLDNSYVGITTLPGALFQTSQRLIGIISITALVLAIYFKRPMLALIFVILSIYIFGLSLARASRYVPVFIVLALLIDVFLRTRFQPHHFAMLFSSFLSYFLIIFQRRQEFQGLSAIAPAIADFKLSELPVMAIGIMVNAFQGAIILDLSLTIPTSYELEYKLLSFSPAPNFIDGFQNVRASNEIRITPFNPMNSFGESLNFGLPFLMAFFIATVSAVLISTTALRIRADLLSVGSMAMCLLFIVIMSQYQVRTSIRFALMTIALSLLAIALNRIVTKKRSNFIAVDRGV